MPHVTITLYKNISDPRYLHKGLTLIADLVSCQITEDCSIVDPVIKIGLLSAYINCNYVYIPNFHRYYYVTRKTILNGEFIELTLHVDVRMSFKSQILNSKIIVDRSGSNPDPYVTDSMVTTRDSILTYTRKLANSPFTSFGSNNYVIMIGGK